MSRLQNVASPNTKYKVFFLGRHGEAMHNLVIQKYGEEAWWNKWSKQSTDGDMTWAPDPDLTQIGIQQARIANTRWQHELADGALVPEKLYCSPMIRALRTCFLTFSGILDNFNEVLVVESARERCGGTPCDIRRTLSFIRAEFPFVVEPNFSEEDIIGHAKEREAKVEVKERIQDFLDRIFENDAQTFISITTHGGWIHYFLQVVGHLSAFAPDTGAILPVVVKATQTYRN